MRATKGLALVLVASTFVSIFSGACGPSGQTQHPPKSILVKIIVEPEQRAAGFNYEGQFEPASVAVAVGGTVTWNNTDTKEHSVVSYDGLFSQHLQYGESFNYTFTRNGTYQYHDVLYDGMDGWVYVR